MGRPEVFHPLIRFRIASAMASLGMSVDSGGFDSSDIETLNTTYPPLGTWGMSFASGATE